MALLMPDPLRFDWAAKLRRVRIIREVRARLELFRNRPAPFLLANAFIRNHPDQLTDAMRNCPRMIFKSSRGAGEQGSSQVSWNKPESVNGNYEGNCEGPDWSLPLVGQMPRNADGYCKQRG
jgi:hypothetical protein